MLHSVAYNGCCWAPWSFANKFEDTDFYIPDEIVASRREVPGHRMVQIRFFNAVEVSSKSVLDPQQGLSNVLDPASMACYAIYEVRSSARDVLHAGHSLSQNL